VGVEGLTSSSGCCWRSWWLWTDWPFLGPSWPWPMPSPSSPQPCYCPPLPVGAISSTVVVLGAADALLAVDSVEVRLTKLLGLIVVGYLAYSLSVQIERGKRLFQEADAARGAAEETAEELRESEDRFRKVFEEGPLGMALVGLDYRFQRVNRALCEMLGYSEDELRRLSFPDVTYPEDIDKDVRVTQRMLRGEIAFYQIEKRYVRKDGEIIWVRLSRSVIRDEEGAPVNALAIVEDITARVEAEKTLERYRALSEYGEGHSQSSSGPMGG